MFLVFLFGFWFLLLGFSLWSRKYKNPYTLTFIFGKKGSGKSCNMVHSMIKDLKHGWTVYTDMNVNINGVRFIKASDLNNFQPVSDSAIYLDEVGISFDNRDFKSFSAGLRDFFKLQRKYRVKVVMNSQAFDVDKKIRDLTDGMILQTNIGNIISVSRPILRTVTLVEATAQGDSRIADNLKFAGFFRWRFYFMPRYFKYFNSFDAPKRPNLPFKEVVNGLDVLSTRSVKKAFSKLRKR